MNVPQKTKPFREGFVAPDGDKDRHAEPALEPSPAPVPEVPAETWPITVKLLHKPIRNNTNEMVKELILREPTGGDINRYGNPVRFNNEGEMLIDERKMTLVIAALSGILPPFIEMMDPRDWNSVAYRLRVFFLPDPAAW
jgi:hypothetical protein